MLYSSAGILAFLIHIIINHDVLWNHSGKEIIPAQKTYRASLFAVTAYYVTDILWGLLYERGLIALTFADTALYFAAMAASIMLWTRYVIEYLKDDIGFGSILRILGNVFFVFTIAVILVNFFKPILFSFDEEGAYHAETARYILLVFQIVMFVATAAYVFLSAASQNLTMNLRHRTIGLFSLAMAGFVLGQTYYPLLPLYAIGCMLGGCLLHSYVLENEKEEYRFALEHRLEESILKGNYYDLLTGLPGMSYFFELAQKKRESLAASGSKSAFLYLNLNGLKFYNQSHGFSWGDRLLRSLADQLVAAFGSENCSRFGSDHFAVLAKAEGLDETLNMLFREWESAHEAGSPCIHIGIYPDSVDNVDISTACDYAKIACDGVSTPYSSFRYYDTDMLLRVKKQQYILSHLNQALKEHWVQVYYQPIVRATSGLVCDEEALARWIDPEHGLLPPSEFIPVLEEAKLIYKLDLYIVDQVLEKLRLMKERGFYLVPQSVNLSRSDFESCDIVEEIRRRVDEAGFPHSLLTIEITESIIGSNFEFMKMQAERFRELGFPVWMDDFGSGYSSLDVLQLIPVDLVKLDMRFMQEFDSGDKSKVILTELMKMTLALGIDTVCEGVEREDQAEFLREIGCSKLQGYYYSKPIPPEQILERYRKGVQIGYENPKEAVYYDAVGRVNLYDLAVISREAEDDFQHYFSTVPMAIIEVNGNKARFVRCNQSYRDFMERTFHINISRMSVSFGETEDGPGMPFVIKLRQCCAEGGRAVFDETMPDGTKVHSFMRRLADNPLTGTTAAAVAVLTISDT